MACKIEYHLQEVELSKMQDESIKMATKELCKENGDKLSIQALYYDVNGSLKVFAPTKGMKLLTEVSKSCHGKTRFACVNGAIHVLKTTLDSAARKKAGESKAEQSKAEQSKAEQSKAVKSK